MYKSLEEIFGAKSIVKRNVDIQIEGSEPPQFLFPRKQNKIITRC